MAAVRKTMQKKQPEPRDVAPTILLKATIESVEPEEGDTIKYLGTLDAVQVIGDEHRLVGTAFACSTESEEAAAILIAGFLQKGKA